MSFTSLKPSEVDLLVKKEFLSGYESYTPHGQMIFNIDTPDRLNEKESVVTTDGDIPQVAEGADYPEAQIRELGTQTFTSLEYKKKFGITELMMDFSNYGSTMKEMRMAGYRARYKQDLLMEQTLSGGFATTTTWDGEYLFSASHEVSDTGVTQSNLITGAMTKDKLNEMYIALKQMKAHDGLKMPLQTAYLVVPTALKMTAWELISSPDDPTTADRSKNFINSLNIKIIEWPLLDDSSTSAYFMCSEKMFHTLTAYQKAQPSMRMYIDEDTGNMYEKVRFVQTQGATDYFGTVGSTGL
jgi:hypothetical protein